MAFIYCNMEPVNGSENIPVGDILKSCGAYPGSQKTISGQNGSMQISFFSKNFGELESFEGARYIIDEIQEAAGENKKYISTAEMSTPSGYKGLC